MRVAVVGAGAMGSLFAGLLALAGDMPGAGGDDADRVEVWLVGAASSVPHLEAIAARGLTLELAPAVAGRLPTATTAMLREPVRGVRVTDDPADAYPCDLAIVLVKSYRTAGAARQLAGLLAPNGVALSLQNGLGHAETLAEYAGGAYVIQGTTTLGAESRGPGRVAWNGLGATLLPVAPALTDARRLLDLLRLSLERAGAPAALTPHGEGAVWGKLVVNCAINPVAALLDAPNGALLAHEETRRLMAEVVREVVRVARAAGIALPFPNADDPDDPNGADGAALAHVLRVAADTAANYCSMAQDLRRGRPTEIEALNGAVVRLAEERGLSASVNRVLADLIRARQGIAGTHLATP